jgi:hypothetical protein
MNRSSQNCSYLHTSITIARDISMVGTMKTFYLHIWDMLQVHSLELLNVSSLFHRLAMPVQYVHVTQCIVCL